MGCYTVHAKDGYEFRPTDLGEREGRIANKYKDTYPSRQYRTAVPQSWLTKGWVIEVKKDAVDTD